jgi:hypothetical protein
MKITIRQCDDWVAVYRDGKKVEENHSCDLKRGLEALGIEFEYVDLYDEIDDIGDMKGGGDPFPETLA